MLCSLNYNLANFQQQGAEAYNRDCGTHFLRQSSQGGGKNPVHPALDTMICFGRRWYRSIKEFFPDVIDLQRNMVTKDERMNWTINV